MNVGLNMNLRFQPPEAALRAVRTDMTPPPKSPTYSKDKGGEVDSIRLVPSRTSKHVGKERTITNTASAKKKPGQLQRTGLYKTHAT